MSKPEYVRYSGAAVLADGVQLKRVQSLDASIDIGQDQVLELANSGIVQYIDQTPTVTVTIDTNLYGSVDNASLLGNALIDKTAVNNIQDSRTGIYSQIIKTPNNITVDEQDFLNSYCTLAIPILEASTTVARTMVIPRAAMTGYSLSFDVGGLATENFTLQASDKYWYLNDWRDVRVFKMTNWHIGHSADATQTYICTTSTSQSFVHLGSALGATARPSEVGTRFTLEPVALVVNDKVYHSTSGGNGPWYFSTSDGIAGFVTAGSGGVVRIGLKGNLPGGVATPLAVEGDDVYLVYNPNIANQTWSGTATDSSDPGYALVSTSGSYGGVGKGYIDAYLYNTDGPADAYTATAAGRTLRLQTVSVDISLSSETLEELGTFQAYSVLRNPPVPVNVTVTANDSDLEAWARACATSYSLSATKELYTSLLSKANYLRVDIFLDKTKNTKLETVWIDTMTVSGDSFNVAVSGNAAQEFTFTADNISLKGYGVVV